MADIPGIRRNGDHAGGIPPNIEYNEDDPPIMNSCSMLIDIHTEDCDGHCDSKQLTDLDVQVINENREWLRIGMNPGNVTRDIFMLGLQVNALIELTEQFITDNGGDGQFAVHEAIQRVRVAEMRVIREQAAEAVRRAKFGIPNKPGLLGPDGQPL